MDRLDVMQLFIRVADTGSFSKAARAANIGQPTVSKLIAGLELRLGAQLLRRTSRGLSLTGAGQDFYDSAVRLLGALEVAESRIGHGQIAPSGLVRVTMTAGLGRMHLLPRLPEFFAQYPDITLDFDISERHVNLIEDGIDMAVRIGTLADASLSARRIGSARFATLASPAYLNAFGTPTVPADLAQHTTVSFLFRGAPRSWEFEDAGGPIKVVPKGPLRTNDAEHIRAAVFSGIGVAHNPTWLFSDAIASGEVTQILMDYAPPPMPIHAVWPGNRRLPSKVTVFIDFLTQIFADNPALRI